MDRLRWICTVWNIPLVAGLLALGLLPVMHNTAPEVSGDSGQGSVVLAAVTGGRSISRSQIAGLGSNYQAARWLPTLAPQSRAILTACSLAEETSAAAGGAGMEGPQLAASPSPATRSSDKTEVDATLGRLPSRANVVVPEPERLLDSVAETGEPIPPRLPERFGQPAAGAKSASSAQSGGQPDREPWQPMAAGPSAVRKFAADAPQSGQLPRALLMPSVDVVQRSHSLELIAREADSHTRRGYELAGRSAYLSARAEFITALRMLSQGLDTEKQTNSHSQALATGLAALKEADDFVPTGSGLEADLDLAGIIGRHRTPVLKGVDTSSLTSMTALQCYLTFSQEQLGSAAGREVAGSMALRALGKLHEIMAEKKLPGLQVAKPMAMVYYQASLLACPQNFMASNDLGVLLARNGRFDDARVALEHSLSIVQQAAGWRNLAVVYQQLGYADWARRAYQRFDSLQKAGAAQPSGSPAPAQLVQWIDPQSFVQTNPEQPTAPAPNILPRPAAAQDVSRTTDTEGQHVARSPLRTQVPRK